MLLLWCLSMIQVFSYPLGKSSFHIFVDLKQAIVSVSGRLSPHNFWDVFHKLTTSLFISLLIFQQLRSILLCKDAFQADLWYKLAFSSPFFYFNDLASILSFRSHCDVVLFTHHLVLSRSCSFPCLSISPECCLKSFLPLVPFFQ